MKKARLTILCDLGFGDAGKGTMADYLCRVHEYTWNVRYTGGPQAAHYVVLPDGRYHCFAQFGSGTFTPGVKTLLAAPTLIAPYNLLAEEEILEQQFKIPGAWQRLHVAADAAIITPWHKMLGRMQEIARGAKRHGSCGQGVGNTVADFGTAQAISVADLAARQTLLTQLKKIEDNKLGLAMILIGEAEEKETRCRLEQTFRYFRDEYSAEKVADYYFNFHRRLGANVCQQTAIIAPALARGESLLFEGAQGALLDPLRGFAPFVTKTTATYHNVNKIVGADIADTLWQKKCAVEKIGIMRAYAHRHGAGPLVTESQVIAERATDHCNITNDWQGSFRVGWLDLIGLRYAIAANDGVDSLALTCLDQLSGLPEIKICRSYLFRGAVKELKKLASFCEWQRNGSDTVIIALKKSAKPMPPEMTKILLQCEPAEFDTLPGWDEDLTEKRSFADLPENAKRFVAYVEERLQRPIKTVSVNPTYLGKLTRT